VKLKQLFITINASDHQHSATPLRSLSSDSIYRNTICVCKKPVTTYPRESRL